MRCDAPPLCWFYFVLHAGRPYSYLSVDVAGALAGFGLLDREGGRLFCLYDMTMSGQQVPAIMTRVSRGPRLLGFDGFLGLHFLDGFRQIHLDRESGAVTLTF